MKIKKIYGILIILLVTGYFIENLEAADTVWKIKNSKGKVKVKKDGKIILDYSDLSLKANDSIMAYNNSFISLTFPDGKTTEYKGPFYKKLKSFKSSGGGSNALSSLKKKLFKPFLRTKEAAVGAVRSSAKHFNEIQTVITDSGIKDINLNEQKKKEMKEALKGINEEFSAASESEMKSFLALVYKNFGQNRTALISVFEYYKTLYKNINKKKESKFLEKFFYAHLLPINIKVKFRNDAKADEVVNISKLRTGDEIILSFTSNVEVMWAAFYSDGKTFQLIEATERQQKEYNMGPSIEITGPEQLDTIYIYISTDPTSFQQNIESYDLKKLSSTAVKGEANTIEGYGNVLFKLVFKHEENKG